MSMIYSLAAQQHGVLSGAQLREAGLSNWDLRQKVNQGELRRAERGLYLVEGFPAGWYQALWLTHLRAGEASVATRRSAAALWKLDGVPRSYVEFAVPPGHQSRDHRVRRDAHLSPRVVTRLGGLPVTIPARTLVDLGAVTDADVVERAMEAALRARRVSVAQLEQMIEGANGPRGSSVLRGVLRRRPAGVAATESDAETRFLQLCRRNGFEEPERQYRLLLAGRPLRVDFAWPTVRLAVEVDGAAVHGTPSALGADLRRQNRLVMDGWAIIRFTWEDIASYEEETASTLRRAWRAVALA